MLNKKYYPFFLSFSFSISLYIIFYPGFLNIDMEWIYRMTEGTEVINNIFPPINTLLWTLTSHLGGYLLLQLIFYSIGISLMANALFKRLMYQILFIGIFTFFPPLFFNLLAPQKAPMVVSFMALSFGFLFQFLFKEKKTPYLLSLLFFLAMATLSRFNGITGLILFIVYGSVLLANQPKVVSLFGKYFKKNDLITRTITFTFLVLLFVYLMSNLPVKQRSTVWQSLAYDMAGTSYFSGKLLIPRDLINEQYQSLSDEEILDIMNYNTVANDFIFIAYKNGNFISPSILNTGAFPEKSPSIFIWLDIITKNKQAYLKHRLEVTKSYLFRIKDPNIHKDFEGWLYPYYLYSRKPHPLTNPIGIKLNPYISKLAGYSFDYGPLYVHGFYFILGILFFIPTFFVKQKIYRTLIFLLLFHNLFLYFGLFLLTPTSYFRYALPCVFSFLLVVILFFKESLGRYREAKSK